MDFKLMLRHYQTMALEALKKDRELQVYIALGLAILVGGSGYYGYHWYAVGRSQKAQQAYMASLEVYQQAMAAQFASQKVTQDQHSLWEQVEVDARHALDQYGRSSYAPFFNAFLAQSLLYQGKRDESLATMRRAVDSMSTKSSYRGLYQVVLDLMLLDGGADEQKQALADLETLAIDSASTVQDMALYYLGVYYNTTGDHARALNYLNRARALQQNHPELPAARSPWQQLAAMKLTEPTVDG